ncbi:hypothetical protein D3C72_2168000 [compost metagenome]
MDSRFWAPFEGLSIWAISLLSICSSLESIPGEEASMPSRAASRSFSSWPLEGLSLFIFWKRRRIISIRSVSLASS